MGSKREHLTAISINYGIITLIEPSGEIGYYRQRGIENIPNGMIPGLINMGTLRPDWNTFKVLPKNYSIAFEDEEVMGRAHATFNVNKAG